MKKSFFVACFIVLMPYFVYSSYNINLIGFLNDIKSVSRHTTSFIDCLNSELEHIKLFRTKNGAMKDLTPEQRAIFIRSIDCCDKERLAKLINAGLTLSGISICTEHLWYKNIWNSYKSIPDKSALRVHYCVTERTKISNFWRERFNKNFDALVVADEWLVDVYKRSGVKLPIFVLPLSIDLNSLLQRNIKKEVSNPFTFGISAVFDKRKNHQTLIQAFHEEFKNNPNVQLLVHGRFTGPLLSLIQRQCRYLGSTNIKVFVRSFSRKEYENFISELDCYVLLSKGEGYSITPREALAAVVPCILSDNTAHKTLCKSGLVYAVPSNKTEPSYCGIMGAYLGDQFNCSVTDARKGLRAVYTKYEIYKQKAVAGREWVKQYTAENLQKKYMSFVKPKKVILGPKNEINSNYIMTNSRQLFEKYKVLCAYESTIFEELM